MILCRATNQLQHIGAVLDDLKTVNGQSLLTLKRDTRIKSSKYHAVNVLDADWSDQGSGQCVVWMNRNYGRTIVLSH